VLPSRAPTRRGRRGSIVPALPIVRVGPARTYTTLAAAFAAVSGPAEFILDNGTYQSVADTGTGRSGFIVRSDSLNPRLCLLDGRGGIGAGFNLAGGKGVLRVQSPGTVRGIGFIGGGGADLAHDGEAGLYAENFPAVSTLSVTDCRFDDCENGIFVPSSGSGLPGENVNLVVTNCEFGYDSSNGTSETGGSHDVYVSGRTSAFVNCRFPGGDWGNTIKSRSPILSIVDCWIAANAGRAIDYPDGGTLTVTDSTLSSAAGANPNFFGYANENENNHVVGVTPDPVFTGCTIVATRASTNWWIVPADVALQFSGCTFGFTSGSSHTVTGAGTAPGLPLTPGTIVSAPTLPASAWPPPGEPTTFATLIFEGTTRSAASANKVVTFSQPFKMGDVPAGTPLLIQRTDNAAQYRTQSDIKKTWADGSAALVAMAAEIPATLADGSTVALDIVRDATHPSPGSNINLATALAGRSAKIGITPSGGSEWLLDLVASLPVERWRTGPLVSEARIVAAVPSGSAQGKTSLRVVADLWITKDGDLWVDCAMRNDAINLPTDATGGPVTYSLRIEIDGSNLLSIADILHIPYTCLPRMIGRTAAGATLTQTPSAWVRQSPSYLVASKVVAPYDWQLGVAPAKLSEMATMRADPAWNSNIWGIGYPNAAFSRNLMHHVAGVGDRDEIGSLTMGQAIWVMTGDKIAQRFSIEQAETWASYPHHVWDRQFGHWCRADERVDVWLDYRGNITPEQPKSTTNPPSQWEPDQFHIPNPNIIPYLLTGRRFHLDELQAQASGDIISRWPAPVLPLGGGARGVSPVNLATANGINLMTNMAWNTRAKAWTMRDLMWAAWLTTAGDPNGTYFTQCFEGNLSYANSIRAAFDAVLGEVTGMYPAEIWEFPTDEAPWQQDFLLSTMIQAEKLGYSGAPAIVDWMLNYHCGRFEVHTGWPYPLSDGISFTLRVGDAAPGTYYNTWEAVRNGTIQKELSYTPRYYVMNHNDPAYPGYAGPNIQKLAASSIAMLRDIRPANSRVAAVWTAVTGTGMPGGAWPATTDADYRLDARNSIMPPGSTRA
jgi:hypothetical protein